jgi:disulfide bond formation protein DsbB
MVAMSGLSVITSVLGGATVAALASSSVVYDALPTISPQTNYPSVGYEATSTSEFGDIVHLAGTDRVLNTVTVTMSDWAKYADYATDSRYAANSATWSLPVTLNVYSSVVDANGVPTTKLATVTQTITVPWRPVGDVSCPDTGYGAGFAWKGSDGTCRNGLAFNATFDLSGLHVTLPDDVIVSIAYNTQTHGYSPIDQSGPYDSLNVAVPAGQVVAVGADNGSDEVFVNSTWSGQYGSAGPLGVFRQDSGWTPNGTVAMQITVTAPPVMTACSATDTVWFNSLSSWNMSETRTAGHNVVTDAGLYIYTDDNTSQAKAAGYLSVDYPLSATGTQTIADSIDYDSDYGTLAPGLQLVVDFDGNGIADGILVGESVYGNSWWLSNSAATFVKTNAPNNGGGYGSSWYGTLSEWLTSFPGAQVKAIGYSLGSGVYAGGTINSITLGCHTYRFDNGAPVATIDSITSFISTPTLTGTVDDADATVAVTVAGVTYATHNNGDGTWSYTLPSLVNGVYATSVVATDMAGNASTLANGTLTVNVPQQSTAPATTGGAGGTTTADTAVLAAEATTDSTSTTTGTVSSTDDNNSQASVAGTSDKKSDNGAWNFLGLAWYWWLLIALILAGLWWFIVAWRRRKQDQE